MNRRAREAADALEKAVVIANDRACDVFVILGDLFDGTRPPPQMIARVQEILMRASTPIVLLGNHEMVTDAEGDNALAPLYPIAQVVETPLLYDLEGFLLALVPFRRGDPTEWLPEVLDRLSPGKGAVLCLHLGIRDKETPVHLRDSPGSIHVDELAAIMEGRKIAATFAGDWHERRFWKPNGVPIVQVGTLCPTGWDNPGFTDYGFMAIWDSETGSGESISVPGPRFVKVRTEDEFHDLLRREGQESPEDSLYVEWVAPPAELAAANVAIREARKDGLIVDGGAFVDKAIQQEAARASARAAASAETLEEAVSAWVSEMELEAGVERARVLERARGYLEVR